MKHAVFLLIRIMVNLLSHNLAEIEFWVPIYYSSRD